MKLASRIGAIPTVHGLVIVLLAVPSTTRAQLEPNPYQAGARAGETDGHSSGRDAGHGLGRTQALVESWVRGFDDGRFAPVDAWRLRNAADEGESEGRRPGLAAGLDVGRLRGRVAASDAYAELRGRPTRRTEAAPRPPAAPPPPHLAACEAPGPTRISLPWGRSVTFRPDEDGRRRWPIDTDVPHPDLPSRSTLQSRAARDGWHDTAGDAWADSYRDAFRRSFHDTFLWERSNVTWSERSRHESDGRLVGQREAERRATCEAYVRAHERGFESAFDEGFDRGFDEGWDEAAGLHDRSAVVRIERASLVDASLDGVFEPGEGVAAEMDLVNAGLVDAVGAPARWRGVVSLASAGAIDERLDAQSRRQVRFDAGDVDEGAPLGGLIAVEVEPFEGDTQSMEAKVGRPVVIDGVTGVLEIRDGGLVAVVRPVLRSQASQETDCDLGVDAEGVSADVGPLGAGASRDLPLVLPAGAKDLGALRQGEVTLRSGDERWMSATWEIETEMGRAVDLTSRLDAESGVQNAALTTLEERLGREVDTAIADPEMYKRLEGNTDLARFAAALEGLPSSTRSAFDAAVSRPLLSRVEDRSVPRRVRKAVRDALERRR